jgi:hypothetical protein
MTGEKETLPNGRGADGSGDDVVASAGMNAVCFFL